MKRIVLPILLFAVLIWLVPLAGFLLGGAFSPVPGAAAGSAQASSSQAAAQPNSSGPGPVRKPSASEQHRGRPPFDLQ